MIFVSFNFDSAPVFQQQIEVKDKGIDFSGILNIDMRIDAIDLF